MPKHNKSKINNNSYKTGKSSIAELPKNVNSETTGPDYLLELEKPTLKTIFWTGVMFTAAILYGSYQHWNQLTKYQGGTIGDLDVNKDDVALNDSKGSCKIAIFYEAHQDALPTQFIDTLLHDFKNHDYTTFLFEEPQGASLSQTVERLSSGIEKIKKVTHIPNEVKEEFVNSLGATVTLLNNIRKLGLTYLAVDMDEKSQKMLYNSDDPHNIKARDKFMAENIDQSCKEHAGGQVLLVGAMHGGIALMLRKLGYDVTSAYIINHPPLHDPDLEVTGRGDNDVMLRTGNVEYMGTYGYNNMYIINKYDGDDSDSLMVNATGFIEDLWS